MQIIKLDKITTLTKREQKIFTTKHPRSKELFERAIHHGLGLGPAGMHELLHSLPNARKVFFEISNYLIATYLSMPGDDVVNVEGFQEIQGP